MRTVVKCRMVYGLIGTILFPFILEAQPLQSPELAPMETSTGVVFQCRAPGADRVYLAGDFNHWANNVNGLIRDEEFAMAGPDDHGVFTKTVSLSPGVYRYKLAVVGGSYHGWFIPEYTPVKDDDGNAILVVDGVPDGSDRVKVAQAPQAGPGGIAFEYHAPKAHIVYLAGTFNQWAGNRNGRVDNMRFAMKGPDEFGIWRMTIPLSPGRYEYQFVINGREWVRDPLANTSSSRDRSVLEVR